jgi:hypothetical protein
MWLASTIGFYSIVEKSPDRPQQTLTVRARVREDLDTLRSKYLQDLSPTQYDPAADYHFRGTAPAESVAKAIGKLVLDIDYMSFKDEVARLQGDERAVIYYSAWSAFRRLQSLSPAAATGLPTFFASIGRRPDVMDEDDDRPLPRDPSQDSS